MNGWRGSAFGIASANSAPLHVIAWFDYDYEHDYEYDDEHEHDWQSAIRNSQSAIVSLPRQVIQVRVSSGEDDPDAGAAEDVGVA